MRPGNLSFRARLTLVAAGAVALAVVASSLVVYLVVAKQLRGQFDSTLQTRATEIAGSAHPEGPYLDVPGAGPEAFNGYIQAVTSNGQTLRTSYETGRLPVTKAAQEVARSNRGQYFSDADVQGIDVRVLTLPVPAAPGLALQIARPEGELLHTLGRLTLLLVVISLGGVAVAVGLGLAVSRAALAPVRRLTGATEKVTETGNLSERIDAEGEDELSQLAASFNRMLGALEESDRARRQLVSDASHELRTPLTSLRTNIEVLARDHNMPEPERERLLSDVVSQLSEMTALINELVQLARGERQPHEAEDVRLDLLVREVVERAQRDYPDIRFVTNLEPGELRGVPTTIARAVSNLLDNAAKWSPPGSTVEVDVRDGEVIVRDHGPGIDESDLPYVFDSFYRAASARKLPGSGLGLAIVKQVAEAHGGGVEAERAPGGGARMSLRLADTNGGGPARTPAARPRPTSADAP
ncbi:MAG TPA: HAMP domain-containing sensor histidine kinase [Gaiellaceae bacterium]